MNSKPKSFILKVLLTIKPTSIIYKNISFLSQCPDVVKNLFCLYIVSFSRDTEAYLVIQLFALSLREKNKLTLQKAGSARII